MEVTTQRVSLWRHSNFLKLWTSETISSFGGQFSQVAMPFVAIPILHATSSELGILQAASTAPFLIFGLLVGVWADRHRRRPIMVVANIGRFILLGSIPVAFLAGRLSLPLLYLVSFLIGVLTVFFDVAYQAYLPSLVQRDQLVEANSKLEASRATATVAGPGIAGFVVGIVTAPFAIALDALSFLGSALSLSKIHQQEEMTARTHNPSMLSEIREGLAVVFSDRRLRSIAGSTATSNFFSSAIAPVATLYLVDPELAASNLGLGLDSLVFGLIFAVGSVGGLIGALLAGRLAARVGVGYAIIGSMLISGIGLFSFYLATPALAIPLLVVGGTALTLSVLVLMIGQFATFLSAVVYNINQVSLRQAIVPLRLQGRMNATMRFLVWGTLPFGALVGGILGVIIGIRPTILIMAVGGSLAFLWVLLSPVRSLKEIPEPLS
ncbi:MAG TPA: MFS transporter [Candidatus Bathyarchaeia archaeon]